MNKLKRIVLTLAKIALAGLLLLGILFAVSRPMYYRLGFFGKRISGTVRVEIDGAVYDLEAEDFRIIPSVTIGNRLSVREQADGSARVAIKAGNYGKYAFSLQLEGLDRPIRIISYQFNWWNVTRFDLQIRVDRAAGTVSFESEAEVLDENGRWSSEPHAATLNLSDERLEFRVVSV